MSVASCEELGDASGGVCAPTPVLLANILLNKDGLPSDVSVCLGGVGGRRGKVSIGFIADAAFCIVVKASMSLVMVKGYLLCS